MNSSYHESFKQKRDEIAFELDPQRKQHKQIDEVSIESSGYRFRIGATPISLTLPEFKLIRFLASKPYRAFTREQIVQTIHSESYPVTDSNLDQLVRSLRAKLGMFSDYIQTVPYIGFRFKP